VRARHAGLDVDSRAPVMATQRATLRALQGLNKSETAAKYGEAQVKIWRRSYDIPPPPWKRPIRASRATIRKGATRISSPPNCPD